MDWVFGETAASRPREKSGASVYPEPLVAWLKRASGVSKILPEPRRVLQSSPLLVARPVHVTAVEWNRRDVHLGARILHLPAVDDVDQRHVLLVVNAAHRERLEDQAEPLGKHLFAARTGVDVADRHRPGLSAGDRRVGWIDEPVSLGEPVDQAAAEPADMTGHALHLRVSNSLDDDAVAGPIVPELADILGGSRGDNGEESKAADN